jgi:hypothetical protein
MTWTGWHRRIEGRIRYAWRAIATGRTEGEAWTALLDAIDVQEGHGEALVLPADQLPPPPPEVKGVAGRPGRPRKQPCEIAELYRDVGGQG